MRTLIAAAVFVAATYSVDAYFFNGQYYGALLAIARQMYQRVR